MIDQKSAIFIPGKFLWRLLGVMFLAAGVNGLREQRALHAS